MNNTFAFLQSPRFWAIVIGAVAVYFQMRGLIGDAEMQLIATITAGFTLVKTIDRNTGDAAVIAAKETGSVTTVSMPTSVSTVTTSTVKKKK